MNRQTTDGEKLIAAKFSEYFKNPEYLIGSYITIIKDNTPPAKRQKNTL